VKIISANKVPKGDEPHMLCLAELQGAPVVPAPLLQWKYERHDSENAVNGPAEEIFVYGSYESSQEKAQAQGAAEKEIPEMIERKHAISRSSKPSPPVSSSL
jgi:hypothetical protein